MLKYLTEKFKSHEKKIQEWFVSLEEQLGPDPIYASVDLRNAGFKVSPVDTNIFPGGFNNLCPSYLREAGRLFKAYFSDFYPNAKRIAILAEEHTRNTYYFENLYSLSTLLRDVGFNVEIASMSESLENEKNEFDTSNGNSITIWTAHIDGYSLKIEPFEPDIILVNNDFSAGIPELIKNIVQPMLPTPYIGWHSRRKSDHFTCYEKLSKTFANIVEIDPWLISAPFRTHGEINFAEEKSLNNLAAKVDEVLVEIKNKYKEYNITDEPFAFVKNDAGTYGMAVIAVHSGDELMHLNKKQRSNMKVGKNLQKVTQVIIQEGLPTIERVHGDVAEPVIYLVHQQVCGGFFRLHKEKDERSNLNQPGMKFSKLCFHEMLGYSNNYPGDLCGPDCYQIIYKNIAKLASYAAGCEIKKIIPK